MTWKSRAHRQHVDSTRFWTLVQLVVYFATLCFVVWIILTGMDRIAAAGPVLCGNGIPDPGEDCLNCPEDISCEFCEVCLGGDCIPQPLCTCGDGVPSPGENCTNCPEDVQCPKGEICVEGRCLTDCVSKVSPMEVLFLFDRSGSLTDEVAALCGTLSGIEDSLQGLGLDVTITIMGIGSGILVPCASGSIAGLHPESWGPAVAQMSAQFPWKTNARIIVPISDEAPFEGDPCNTPQDFESIQTAITAANKYNVIVSPIMGEPWGPEPKCVIGHAQLLAAGTGGTWYPANNVNMQELVINLIQATLCGCAGDLNGDAKVDILDFLIWLSHWGLMDTDIDRDGDTDALDLILLFNHWGRC